MTGIAPGAYVRVTRGMYAGDTGRTLAIHQSAEGPYATLDVGNTHNIGVLLTALELVGAVPTAEQERDAAIARCRAASQTIIAEIGAVGPENVEESARRAVVALRAALAERDRLRRELEALRHSCRREARVSGAREDILVPLADRLDAILRGGES